MSSGSVNTSGVFTNGWVVGIVTSLVATGIISLLSYFLISKRRRLEYLQRVSIGNRELIYAIRPGIAEGNVPKSDVLEALARATARRYGLKREELFGPPELSEELIKEVMDSSFLSSVQKSQYCDRLSLLNTFGGNQAQVDGGKEEEGFDKQVAWFSALTGIVGGLVSLLISIRGVADRLAKIADWIGISGALVIFSILAMYLFAYAWFRKRSQRATLERDLEKALEIEEAVIKSMKLKK